jgi:hypothetical protein
MIVPKLDWRIKSSEDEGWSGEKEKQAAYDIWEKAWEGKQMNGHMNLDLKIIREIRIWSLGLGKDKKCSEGNKTGIFIVKS